MKKVIIGIVCIGFYAMQVSASVKLRQGLSASPARNSFSRVSMTGAMDDFSAQQQTAQQQTAQQQQKRTLGQRVRKLIEGALDKVPYKQNVQDGLNFAKTRMKKNLITPNSNLTTESSLKALLKKNISSNVTKVKNMMPKVGIKRSNAKAQLSNKAVSYTNPMYDELYEQPTPRSLQTGAYDEPNYYETPTVPVRSQPLPVTRQGTMRSMSKSNSASSLSSMSSVSSKARVSFLDNGKVQYDNHPSIGKASSVSGRIAPKIAPRDPSTSMLNEQMPIVNEMPPIGTTE